MPRAWWACLLLATLGCGDDSAESETCGALCGYVAGCFSPCEPEDGASCNQKARYRTMYDACREECEGAQARPECTDATEGYATCIQGKGCTGKDFEACRDESRRYDELCINEPGAEVCPTLCAELSTGCTPYTSFGLRGEGCDASCMSAAADLDCLDALYAFDECSPGSGATCHPLGDDCASEVSDVQALCEGMDGVSVDPEEQSLCESVAPEQCGCELWNKTVPSECETLATERCLFELGYGPDCRNAIETFDACMREIDACDRDALSDDCMSEWTRYNTECG